MPWRCHGNGHAMARLQDGRAIACQAMPSQCHGDAMAMAMLWQCCSVGCVAWTFGRWPNTSPTATVLQVCAYVEYQVWCQRIKDRHIFSQLQQCFVIVTAICWHCHDKQSMALLPYAVTALPMPLVTSLLLIVAVTVAGCSVLPPYRLPYTHCFAFLPTALSLCRS